jgi:hypothetical protein
MLLGRFEHELQIVLPSDVLIIKGKKHLLGHHWQADGKEQGGNDSRAGHVADASPDSGGHNPPCLVHPADQTGTFMADDA